MDYCDNLLYGIPEYQTSKLQRVMNASATLIYRAHKFCHVTPLLAELHWLPVRCRMHYKVLLITFKILQGLSPKYLSDLISIHQPLSYNLRRNDHGRLLERPSAKTKKTTGDRAFQVAVPFLFSLRTFFSVSFPCMEFFLVLSSPPSPFPNKDEKSLIL